MIFMIVFGIEKLNLSDLYAFNGAANVQNVILFNELKILFKSKNISFSHLNHLLCKAFY